MPENGRHNKIQKAAGMRNGVSSAGKLAFGRYRPKDYKPAYRPGHAYIKQPCLLRSALPRLFIRYSCARHALARFKNARLIIQPPHFYPYAQLAVQLYILLHFIFIKGLPAAYQQTNGKFQPFAFMYGHQTDNVVLLAQSGSLFYISAQLAAKFQIA